MKAKVGDTIEWSFPENHNSVLAGETYSAKVSVVFDNGDYGVYASYGQDIIPPGKCKIIKIGNYILV